MKKLVLPVLIMSVFIVAGCGGNVDIRIVEIGSMLRHDVSVSGNYREAILSTNESKKCFYTLQRFGNKMFKLRTRNFEGEETNMEIIPLFSEFYCSPENTVSPDGKNFIYLDRKDNAIKLYNLDSRTSSTLLPNASSGISIKMMEFISDDTMIIALDDDEEVGRREGQIIKHNIRTGTQSVLTRPSRLLMFVCAFSPEKTKMAYSYIDNNKIRIVDLVDNGGTPETIVGEEKEAEIDLPCWSPDGNKIGYVDVKGVTIKVFDIATKKTKNVKTFNSKLICYKLKFTDNGHLIYLLGGAGEEGVDCMDQPLRILEIATGRDVKMINNFESNGDLFVVENGKRIIGEVGF